MLSKVLTSDHYQNNHSNNESGNIFFTLFGAVIIVGLLGTIIVSTMRGPLSTMVNVQTRSKAEIEMDIASRLVLLEATQLPSDGDCDGDGFVEPLEYLDAAGAGPTGGGFLPNAVASSRIDPWGINYGYCGWDAGGTTGAIACDTDGSTVNERLDGNANPTDETYTVVAIISAGPDQTFQTSCSGGATPSITKAGDDIVVEFTYATATAATNGLWNLKSGDPSTAEISKDLEVTGGASFTNGIDLTGSTAALQLGAASMLFPNEATLIACNVANNGLIRINTAADPDTIQLCDAANGWVSISNGFWSGAAADDIFYNTGASPQVGIGTATPGEALDVVGNIDLTGDVTAGGALNSATLAATGNATVGGTLGVTGTTSLGVLGANGAVTFDDDLTVDGLVIFENDLDLRDSMENSGGDLEFEDDVNITGNLVVTGTSDLQGNVSNTLANLILDDDVDVAGDLDTQGQIRSTTGPVDIDDDLDVGQDVSVAGDVGATDITAANDVNAGSTINVNGDQLGPPLNCAAAQKLEWNNGVGWSCETDLQGGSGGGAPALDDVTDVDATTPANGDCIVYNNGTGNWEGGPCTGDADWLIDTVNNYVYNTTDAIGIGTATPQSSLHVFNDTATNSVIIERNNLTDNAKLYFYNENGVSKGIIGLADSSNDVEIVNQHNTTGSILFLTNGGAGATQRAHINSAGNVGIGDFSSDIIDSTLHIATGDMRLDGGVGNEAGCIRFNDASDQLEYSDDCSSFTTFSFGATVADDSLDWDKFIDAMTLDATTTIDMDTNTADLNFDANTFVIDSSTNRIGVGIAVPEGHLHLSYTGGTEDTDPAILKIQNETVQGSSVIQFRENDPWGFDIENWSSADGTENELRFEGFTSGSSTGNRVIIDRNTAHLGVLTSPATALDVAGTIKIADGGEACAAGIAGAMRYNAGNLDYCNGTSWTSLSSGGADADWSIDVGNSYVYNTGDSIGIGTTTPDTILDVEYAGGTDTTDMAELHITNTTSQGSAQIRLAEQTDNQGFFLRNFSNAAGTVNHFSIGSLGTGDRYLIIDRDTGEAEFRRTPVSVTNFGSDARLNVQTTDTTSSASVYLLADSDAAADGAVVEYDQNGGVDLFRIRTGTGGTYNDRFVIEGSGGDIGIGTSSPTSDLHVHDDTGSTLFTLSTDVNVGAGNNVQINFESDSDGTPDPAVIGMFNDGSLRFSSNGNIVAPHVMIEDSTGHVGIANTSPNVELDVIGDIEYTGTITDVSDRRLKENIKPIDNILDRLAMVDAYSFTMKGDEKGRIEFGVMAQELEQIFPELVHTADDKIGTKSVNYVGLIAPMIEATKELRRENDALRTELTDLTMAQKKLNKQVSLLTHAASDHVGKASMLPYIILLILGFLGGTTAVIIARRKV